MESRFKKYRRILQDEAKKVRAGEKSKVFNLGNIAASILFVGCISVWSFYFVVKPSSKSEFFRSELLKIVFFDVGQGDSALIITPLKKTILIDAGGKPGYVIEESEGTSEEKEDAAKNLIIPYLTKELQSHYPRLKLGATLWYDASGLNGLVETHTSPRIVLDYFIATHSHADHYGGFVTLIENKIIPEIVYDIGFPKTYPLYETFLQMIKNARTKYVVPAVGETIDLGGGVLMRFLGPIGIYKGTKSDENNSSIVLKIIFGNISILFTGDVELEAENDLVSWRGELKSTVLKTAHHGSKTSTTSPFLDRVSPEIAIISSGRGNKFGHPAEETIKKLADRNINIYRTDQNGTITLLTDGTSIKITTEK